MSSESCNNSMWFFAKMFIFKASPAFSSKRITAKNKFISTVRLETSKEGKIRRRSVQTFLKKSELLNNSPIFLYTQYSPFHNQFRYSEVRDISARNYFKSIWEILCCLKRWKQMFRYNFFWKLGELERKRI